MKNLIIIILLTVSILSCKAQVPLTEKYGNITNGVYYQDTNNDLGKLEGTWEYTNGNEIFELVLIKKVNRLVVSTYRNISYNQDVLYGEYQYIDANGDEIHNSLNNIDSYTDVSQNLIYGNYIIDKNHLPICDDCLPDEKRVEVSIVDSEREYFDYDMLIRHFAADQFGQAEHITIKITKSGSAWIPDGEPDTHRLPKDRELILYKQ